MRSTSLYKMSAVIAVGALALAGCGSRGGTTSGSSSSTNTVVEIGVDAPLTGSLAALGLGIQYSSDLAVKDANKNNEVPGVTFKLVAKDDQKTASIGQQNATSFVADSGIVGVVGPLNSSVAQSMQKVFDDANVTEVSPANTNPSLTQGPNWQTTKVRPYKSYFRVVTTDAVQGPYAADYVYNKLGIKTVATVNDGKTYGAGLAQTFTQEFTKLGGKVAVAQTATDSTQDYSSIVSAIKGSAAKLVYYGGEFPAAAPLTKQLKGGGDNIPVMGGDGMQDPTYISLAGAAAANGDYATVPGASLSALPSAQKFITDYKAANYPSDYSVYGGYSYDATWSIIEAVKAVVAANGGKVPSSTDFRKKVEAAMQSVSFSGVTGQVSFDQYGDTGNKVLTMYQVENGKWDNGIATGSFTG